MADDKQGREAQADTADKRQRERAIATELERRDEPEPPVDPSELAYFETELESVSFPATGADIVAAVGDREIEAADGPHEIAELLPDTDVETFDAPEEVRVRIQRPTVASAMKRVVEAAGTLPNVEFGTSQRDAYERTFRELEAIDADDDDEGIRAIREWVVERIHEKGKLPGSRAVRREAASFCRENGYEVRNDEWLGI
ncbi:DUF5789 family protein [Natronomonas amylolytica]|uniref:DUF5789 family protein n=1 Tax=Natronomonas amylolytica TaxID=3108498 RepID=UPI0030084C23